MSPSHAPGAVVVGLLGEILERERRLLAVAPVLPARELRAERLPERDGDVHVPEVERLLSLGRDEREVLGLLRTGEHLAEREEDDAEEEHVDAR